MFYSAVLLSLHLTGKAVLQRSGSWLSHNLGRAVLSDLPLVAAHTAKHDTAAVRALASSAGAELQASLLCGLCCRSFFFFFSLTHHSLFLLIHFEQLGPKKTEKPSQNSCKCPLQETQKTRERRSSYRFFKYTSFDPRMWLKKIKTFL